MLYGLCDINCLRDSFNNLRKFRESGLTELKLQEKRVKVIQLKQKLSEYISTDLLNEKTPVEGYKVEVQILKQFCQN